MRVLHRFCEAKLYLVELILQQNVNRKKNFVLRCT